MIVVDTRVWIDYFNGVITPQTDKLDNLLGVKPIAIGDLILTEVLQGFRQDDEFKTALKYLEEFTIFHLLNLRYAIQTAKKLSVFKEKRNNDSQDS